MLATAISTFGLCTPEMASLHFNMFRLGLELDAVLASGDAIEF
jgi:hypothetical protein